MRAVSPDLRFIFFPAHHLHMLKYFLSLCFFAMCFLASVIVKHPPNIVGWWGPHLREVWGTW